MKNTTCLLFVLLLHPNLRAQDEKRHDATQAGKKDTSVVNEILEAAYLLTAISKYEDAHAYFVFVLKDVPTIQVYNNAGIAAVMDALNYFRPTEPEVKFHHPVELDLKSVGTRNLKDFKDIRAQKLGEAITHFDAAIQLDTGYAPAYLNKACAYSLLGDIEQARVFAGAAANKPGYEKTAVDVLVLQAILYAREGDTTQAKEVFKTAFARGSALAEHNLKILQGLPIEKPPAGIRLGDIETIDGIALNDPYNIPEYDTASEVAINAQIHFYHNLHPGSNSYFYFNDNTATGQQTYFLLTGPGYTGPTAEKLKSGAARADIEAAYKQPLRTVETLDGEILAYPSIIFILGKDGKLERWAIYGEEG